MHVHALQTGSLVGNETFLRGDGLGALLHRRREYEFPVLAFVLEHPEGLVAIDTGMRAGTSVPRYQRRFVPRPQITPEGEIGPRMRAAGLDPREVSKVILTHLDWDHAGGLHHFPRARVLIHRPEWEFSQTRMGGARYQPRLWPDALRPELYDVDGELELLSGVHVVSLPGHSIGHVGVRVGDLLFAGDHVLREDWFREDLARGRMLGLGQFFPQQARATSRRLAELDAILLPSHDATAPQRLRASGASRFGTGTTTTPRRPEPAQR